MNKLFSLIPASLLFLAAACVSQPEQEIRERRGFSQSLAYVSVTAESVSDYADCLVEELRSVDGMFHGTFRQGFFKQYRMPLWEPDCERYLERRLLNGKAERTLDSLLAFRKELRRQIDSLTFHPYIFAACLDKQHFWDIEDYGNTVFGGDGVLADGFETVVDRRLADSSNPAMR